MPDIVLIADTSRPTGSRNSRRLRHHGHVPAVVYGHGISATPVSVEARALRSALSTPAGHNVVLDLEIDGTHHMAMAKVVDHHPVRHTISHVDFLVINRDEKVTVDVPFTVVGEALLVTREGGVIELLLHTVSVSTLPGSIPDAIEIDVTNLEVGGSIRIGEVTFPRGVTTDLDPDTPVVMAAHASVVEEVPGAAEGEGAEAQAGAAPAAAPAAATETPASEPAEGG